MVGGETFAEHSGFGDRRAPARAPAPQREQASGGSRTESRTGPERAAIATPRGQAGPGSGNRPS
eukprot:1908637-Rhodomonas_salina.1